MHPQSSPELLLAGENTTELEGSLGVFIVDVGNVSAVPVHESSERAAPVTTRTNKSVGATPWS
jgi:hypothetical protein